MILQLTEILIDALVVMEAITQTLEKKGLVTEKEIEEAKEAVMKQPELIETTKTVKRKIKENNSSSKPEEIIKKALIGGADCLSTDECMQLINIFGWRGITNE